jgi:hypothetical protein
MLDRFVMVCLIQTPDIPPDLRDAAVGGAQRRYTNYVAEVNNRMSSDEIEASAGNGPAETVRAPAQGSA